MTQKLYILIRTDMDSMTVGRIAAQASHAANQFVGDIHAEIESRKLTSSIAGNFDNGKRYSKFYKKWYEQTNSHFGTVIVLNGGSEKDIFTVLEKLDGEKYFWQPVIDPEYSVKDGDTIHVVNNVLTCAYIFPIHDMEENLELMDLPLL